jgi:tRNA (guanine-N7-)-methyltransferase
MSVDAKEAISWQDVWIHRDRWPTVFLPTQLFCDGRPIVLEIGSGRGLFLLHQSRRRPDVHFLGVEWSGKYSKEAAVALARRGAGNAKIVCEDAKVLLDRFPSASITDVHVYFPDPWWKRRHKKRRLIDPAFVAQLARVQQRGCMLHLATDVEEYFGVMGKVFAREPEYQRLTDPPAPEPKSDYLTHFERKYRIEGRAIYRAQFLRR